MNQIQYSQSELDRAFSVVENKNHWKDEINADVHFSALGVTAAAIEHFTATSAIIVSTDHDLEVCRIHADGYWRGPAN